MYVMFDRYSDICYIFTYTARWPPVLLAASRWQQPSPPSLPHYLSLFKISFFLKNWTFTCTLSSPRAHNCLSIGGDVPQMLDNIPISLHGDGFQLQTALSCSSVQLLRTTAVRLGKAGGGRRENLHLLLHCSWSVRLLTWRDKRPPQGPEGE